MDYTKSLDAELHAPTGNAYHEDTKALPTVWSDKDANGIIWSLMEVVKAGGGKPMQFDKDVPASYRQLLGAINKIVDNKNGVRNMATLPSDDIGPIWSDKYNSLMTWQKFDANGADYEGYASVLVGSVFLDSQPNPRAGFIKMGAGTSLSKTTYAALWHWGIHNGLKVEANAWVNGAINMCDLGNGNFKLYDLRGFHQRVFADGFGVDAARVFGSAQASQNLYHGHTVTGAGGHGHTAWTDAQGQHTHNLTTRSVNNAGTSQGSSGAEYSTLGGGAVPTTDMSVAHAHNVGIGAVGDHTHGVYGDGGAEARGFNTAFLGCIKF
jgi:hypothetical protein